MSNRNSRLKRGRLEKSLHASWASSWLLALMSCSMGNIVRTGAGLIPDYPEHVTCPKTKRQGLGSPWRFWQRSKNVLEPWAIFWQQGSQRARARVRGIWSVIDIQPCYVSKIKRTVMALGRMQGVIIKFLVFLFLLLPPTRDAIAPLRRRSFQFASTVSCCLASHCPLKVRRWLLTSIRRTPASRCSAWL